jgi:hypothetical protein
MSATRVIHKGGWCVRLDLSEQVLSLDAPEWDGARRDDRLSPTMPSGDNDQLVSAAALLMKAKQFDDGLYAAVELAAQAGAGRFAGKASLLAALAAALADAPAAAALVFGACQLGGVPARPAADLQDAVAALVNDFLGDELRSKPREEAFGRGEEHQRRQVLGDVHEAVLGGPLHEDHGAGADGLLPPAGPERRLPADDDVHLVLGVRLLLVSLPGPEAVAAHAQGGDSQELPPALIAPFALRHQAAQVEGLRGAPHAGAPCSGVVGVQANL